MKKTLAIILSVLMMFALIPVSGSAAEVSYDRSAVAGGNVADLTAEQMASVILDWVDRQIAKVTEDFETFEIDVMGTTVAVDIPEIKTLDDVITYKDYLSMLEGDFANLDTTNLITREAAGSSLDFIYGVIQFMADNADIFGKAFHWEEGKVFDYGKVGEYILALDPTVEENKKIIDFYNNYLIGNDIQDKFIDWVAGQMNYTYTTDDAGERTENFDDIINNGILNWFAGLCETNGILSADGITALKAYDLRTTDIYTLVKNFVGLVESDNQVKINTYYTYLLDTVVRSMLKTALGQSAVIGEATTLPASFANAYTDLALLEEISGGTVYYKDGENYYAVTVADGAATANALTWENTLDVEFDPPVVGVYTGATDTADAVISDYNCDLVQEYRPAQDYTMTIYSAYADQINGQLGEMPEGMTAAVTNEAIPEAITALMVEENAKAMQDLFAVKADMGETTLLEQVITFEQIRAAAEATALEEGTKMAESMVGQTVSGVTIKSVQVNGVSITLAYNGYATEDEFICQVTSAASADIKLVGTMTVAGMEMEVPVDLPGFDVSSYINNPVATIVLDNLSGSLDIDAAAMLPDFLDTDFVIDYEPIAFSANYDTYNGVVGQINHILYGIVDMLVTDNGMAELKLVDGDNTNLTDNLQKICDTVNDMMAQAEELLNDAGLQDMLTTAGVDVSEILNGLNLDLLYMIDFSSVEALYVSAISLGLDILDDGTNETVAALHVALEGCEDLDAMAVAATDYVLGKCVPVLNEKFADKGLNLEIADATGSAKDVIMTKLVALAYDAVTWGVDTLLNDIVNSFIANINTEAGTDLPDVAFTFGVQEGATWSETLTAMVNRVYELADGIIIACDNTYTDTFDKISAVANAILPLGSLASNCASDNFAFDINLVLNDFIFADALAGDSEGFLGLFETATKTADVAASVPVTKALINASQHIVDSVFPGTVVADNYTVSVTVQEEFTSGDNDVVIAANNMRSINERKADLVPAALNLVRESGILPYFAKCELDHAAADLETVLIAGTAATCTVGGVEDAYACADCGYIISGGATINALGHSYSSVVTKAATCTAEGVETFTCSDCSDTYTKSIAKLAHSYGAWTTQTAATCTADGVSVRSCACGAKETTAIAAAGHTDADGNYTCDTCGTALDQPEMNFFEKIIAFFRSIIDWFKNLFS